MEDSGAAEVADLLVRWEGREPHVLILQGMPGGAKGASAAEVARGLVTEIERCRAEQTRCIEHISDGRPDSFGAWLGLSDWLHEEIMIEQEQGYEAFLRSKVAIVPACGRTVEPGDIHPMLFPFQRDLVRWSVRKGRAALFADTGLGKTFMSLEWARLTGANRTLFVAPLSVARQTIKEAVKIGLDVRSFQEYVPGASDTRSTPFWITNYERLDNAPPELFDAVVLDESSILKSLDGKTRSKLIAMFGHTPYRLCCTATPAPNDIAEIANHAEFLGIMSRVDMLATF